ncbi:MAG: hypothetical protein M9941_14060 [Anaerolineae bacterium]|nr:hypothetical protein [Anaerolineae bacterium]MCO5187422.1 hypothetical protein [Anaerolineae bacterium]MCO5198865.1 hypothetical protein [Anaerolineae bacterium]
MSILAAPLILGFLLATAYAAAFHLFFGGSGGRIVLYVLASWVGFVIGQLFGRWLGIDWFSLGTIHLLSASIGSWILLFFSRWLAAASA